MLGKKRLVLVDLFYLLENKKVAVCTSLPFDTCVQRLLFPFFAFNLSKWGRSFKSAAKDLQYSSSLFSSSIFLFFLNHLSLWSKKVPYRQSSFLLLSLLLLVISFLQTSRKFFKLVCLLACYQILQLCLPDHPHLLLWPYFFRRNCGWVFIFKQSCFSLFSILVLLHVCTSQRQIIFPLSQSYEVI